MPTSLEMRTNGTWHDIPNTNHLREKRGRKEGGLKRVHNQRGEAKLLNLLTIATWLNHMHAFASLLLVPGKPCPNSMRPHPCVYVQRQSKKPADK